MYPPIGIWLPVWTICWLNEILLFSGQWVVSPSTCSNRNAPANVLPSALITSLVYGVVEPLYTALLVWASTPPWLLVYALKIYYFIVAGFATLIMGSLISPPTAESTQLSKDGTHGTPSPGRTNKWTKLFFVSPYHLALQLLAASNAALVLYLQSFGATSRPGGTTMIVLDCCALSTILMGAYIDYHFGSFCLRATYLGQYGWRYAKDQLICLAVVIVSRMIMRYLLGMSLFLAQYPGGPDVLFGSDRWQWIRDITGTDIQ
jgi:hypothetical protein